LAFPPKALREAVPAQILGNVADALKPGGTVVIQTVHPWTVSADQSYADGWRTDAFACAQHPFPEPMPWYFRTLQTWVASVTAAELAVGSILEPRHPSTGVPLSLLIVAHRRNFHSGSGPAPRPAP
jgi:2-polyprenyl-3-methyl-5-hydroxy-6-metoxy-1,4-benzoquinol methylase